MAQAITLTVAIFDGTIVQPSPTAQVFPVASIKNPIWSAVSAGDYNVGTVNALVYADTGFGIKAYYVNETPDAIKTAMNA